MRLDRLLSIIIILLNRNRVTAKELSKKFEVSVRTIYRDIDAINLSGIPIVSYPGNDGGFGIMENYKLDRQLLTIKEMGAMLSALQGVNLVLEDSNLESSREKIKSLIPLDQNNQVDLQMDQVVIDIIPWGFPDNLKINVKKIHSAIGSHRLASFTYVNAKGEVLSRDVEPMTLILKGFGWYLFGFCREKKDYRTFKLGRIKDLIIKDEVFLRRDACYKNYFNIDDNKKGSNKVNLILKFSSNIRFRIEEYYDEKAIEYLDNGDLLVRVSFPEDDWIYSYLLGFGDDLEIIEPQHIKKVIIEKAEKMLKKYQR